MNRYLLTVLIFFGITLPSQAYVTCKNVPVEKLRTSGSSSYHKFNELGAVGPIVFLAVSSELCTDTEGTDLAGGVWMVFDEHSANSEANKDTYTSFLLSANAQGRTVSFTGENRGVTEAGRRMIRPWVLTID